MLESSESPLIAEPVAQESGLVSNTHIADNVASGHQLSEDNADADDGCDTYLSFQLIDLFKATRGACRSLPGPCDHSICRHNLISNNEGRRPKGQEAQTPDLSETCSLALAERGGMTLEEVAQCFSLTRERIRQIELFALRKLRSRVDPE